MARKWKIAIAVWIGVLLDFGIGSQFPKDADLLLIIFHAVLLAVITVWTVVIWLSDRRRGDSDKSYHLAAYPRGFLRFVFDEPEEEKQEKAGGPATADSRPPPRETGGKMVDTRSQLLVPGRIRWDAQSPDAGGGPARD
ncbi:MAG: hypothetical protein GY953_09730 [bacterium]|nr:hypothetical protein [bacterium]